MSTSTKSNSAKKSINAAMEQKQREIYRKKNKKSPIRIILPVILVITCLCIGFSIYTGKKVTVPDSSKKLCGENYEDVQRRFKDAGFSNIATTPVKDLKVGLISKEGDVESIEISGINSFDKGETFKKNSKVVIFYHAFSEDKD